MAGEHLLMVINSVLDLSKIEGGKLSLDRVDFRLHALLEEENRGRDAAAQMPHLAALVCHSLFDLAMFDAFGRLHGRPVFALWPGAHAASLRR